MTDDEQAVYQSKLALLSEEHLKDQPSIGKIKTLMKQTFSGRRKWILLDLPQVHTVLEVNSSWQRLIHLYSFQLRRELTLILKLPKDHCFSTCWEDWQRKILDYSKIEAPRRQSISSIYNQYTADMNEGKWNPK